MLQIGIPSRETHVVNGYGRVIIYIVFRRPLTGIKINITAPQEKSVLAHFGFAISLHDQLLSASFFFVQLM